MKRFVVVIAILLCLPAKAESYNEKLEYLRSQVIIMLKRNELKRPPVVVSEETLTNADAQVECYGVADDIKCDLKIDSKELTSASLSRLEFIAAHETCHIKLEHIGLDIMDYIMRRQDIEDEADRCTFRLLGKDNFLADIVEEFYQAEDPNRTVPKETLERIFLEKYAN